MASLKPGLLAKLVEDMNNIVDQNEPEDDRKPVLLQIRSIIPVLEKGNLWPNRGFYLKVSDLSHAIYASLPQEENEMILNNELKLGQLIYVQKLQASHPVPVLWGITPLAGRRPCEGIPEDIMPTINLLPFLEPSDATAESIVEKGVISEKRISHSRKLSGGSSDSEMVVKKTRGLEVASTKEKARSLSASKVRPSEPRLGSNYANNKKCDVEKIMLDVPMETQKGDNSFISSLENGSDSDCTISSLPSRRLSKRRSWTESEVVGVKDIFDSLAVKREMRRAGRSQIQSAHVSPVRSVRYDSSDESSCSMRRKRDVFSLKKSVKSVDKSKATVSQKNYEDISPPALICSSVDDIKGVENRISWDSLPSNLVKLGKEVIRQRDASLLAAVEALQETCASQRLIKCLSTYSKFQSINEDPDLQHVVDQFLSLQEDLAHARRIMESLTNISPLRASHTNIPSSTGTVKEVLDLASERNKNATSWIKSAIAFDINISPFTDTLHKARAIKDPLNKSKNSKVAANNINNCTKPKGTFFIKRHNSGEFPFILAANHHKDDQRPDQWSRGSTLGPAADLASCLQDEYRSWFLNNVEKYLEEVESKVSLMESDDQISVFMCNVKRVSDWLDVIVGKEGSFSRDDQCKESFTTLSESEVEACGRIRNKIFCILLKNVERTTMGLENSKVSIEV